MSEILTPEEMKKQLKNIKIQCWTTVRICTFAMVCCPVFMIVLLAWSRSGSDWAGDFLSGTSLVIALLTLINIADIKGVKAEDCLEQAFNVIKLRKGLTRESGDFVRYGKLGLFDQQICDEKQGNDGD